MTTDFVKPDSAVDLKTSNKVVLMLANYRKVFWDREIIKVCDYDTTYFW